MEHFWQGRIRHFKIYTKILASQVRCLDILANSCLGIWIYLLNESDAHRLRVWTVNSGTLLAIAVVATPILNEWPEYCLQSIPAGTSDNLSTCWCDNGQPSLNRGPLSCSLTTMCANMAGTNFHYLFYQCTSSSGRFSSLLRMVSHAVAKAHFSFVINSQTKPPKELQKCTGRFYRVLNNSTYPFMQPRYIPGGRVSKYRTCNHAVEKMDM